MCIVGSRMDSGSAYLSSSPSRSYLVHGLMYMATVDSELDSSLAYLSSFLSCSNLASGGRNFALVL